MKTIFQDSGNFHVNTVGEGGRSFVGAIRSRRSQGCSPTCWWVGNGIPSTDPPAGVAGDCRGLEQLNCEAPPHAAEVGSNLLHDTLPVSLPSSPSSSP